jgi:glucokinase
MRGGLRSRHSVAVTVDVGGTDLKSAVVDASGKILHRSTIPSESKQSKEKILEKILSAVSREEGWASQHRYRITGVGFGIPGIVSLQGIVHRSPHFPDWRDYPLRSLLKKSIPFSIVLDNDANMAALGEAWKGAGRKEKNFILLTLGTGIGGGIVIDGKLHRGDSGFAGELGHVVIERNGRRCHCGGRGCLEMYASATGIQEELQKSRRTPFRKRGDLISPEDLYRHALRGNKTAKEIYRIFGEALGTGIASIVNALDIERMILGGGLSGAWRFFIESTRKAIARHTYPTTAKRIRIRRAALGNNAGLIGAARAVFAVEE